MIQLHKTSFIGMFILIMTLISSCTVSEIELDEIEELKLEQFSKDGIIIKVKAKINNPNSFSIRVTDSSFDVYLNDKYISKGKFDDKIKLVKKTIQTYEFTLKTEELENPNDILPILLKAALTGKVKAKAKGYIKGKTFLFISKKVDVNIEEVLEINRGLLNN